MQNTVYIAVSGQLSLMRRLESLAQNMANINTTGFRALGMKFEQMLSPYAENHGDRPSFVTSGKSFIITKPGALTKTDNPLDVAINGEAWFAVEKPTGVVYTRDGRLTITAEGQLVSASGDPILDTNESPIFLNPHGPIPVINRSGTVVQGMKPVATLGLYVFPEKAKLRYGPMGSLVADTSVEPVEDKRHVQVMQGFLEESNVNGVTEMTNMITISRAFEQIDSLLRTQEGQETEAIRALGSKNG